VSVAAAAQLSPTWNGGHCASSGGCPRPATLLCGHALVAFANSRKATAKPLKLGPERTRRGVSDHHPPASGCRTSRAPPPLLHMREDVRPTAGRVPPGRQVPGLHPYLRADEVTSAPREQHGREDTRLTNWQRARALAKQRDGGRCVRCGASERLEVHHVVPLEQGGERVMLSNLLTLCPSCHEDEERKAKAPFLDTRSPTPSPEFGEKDSEKASAAKNGKACRKCVEEKPTSEFPRNPRCLDDLSSWCKSCHNEATRAWRVRKAEAAYAAHRRAHDEHSAQLRKWNQAWRKRVEAERVRRTNPRGLVSAFPDAVESEEEETGQWRSERRRWVVGTFNSP
jgi:5-methylcytosine-specific restriction endonuclease McrA